jgi:cytochrome c553
MSRSARTDWILLTIIAAAIILAGGTLLIYRTFFQGALPGFGGGFDGFASNGERIYFTGTSRSGPPITSQMRGMHRMQGGMLGCAACHGEDGSGGRVRMMMATVVAPDIRWSHLTDAEHEDEHEDHPPYDETALRRAIRRGIDPAGEPLEWSMPRWEMTDAQLDDLAAFLKTLE